MFLSTTVKISQDQLREAAQILYPKEWREDPASALLAALRYLNEAAIEFEIKPTRAPKAKKAGTNNSATRPEEIGQLEEHLKARSIHATAAAQAIGVNAVTLYSWFHGQSRPNTGNLTKIRSFLSRT
jgi:hypothetical protein